MAKNSKKNRNQKRAVSLWFQVLGICLLFTSSPYEACAGSEFYFTVDRTFSSDEKPKVRLDFLSSAQPLELRVLKPNSVESLIEGQIDIRRTYEEPLASINPGHYLAKGLNQVKAPLPLFRRLLSDRFRANFGGHDFSHPLRDLAGDPLVAEPREIALGIPAGYQIVHRQVIDLQKGGDTPVGLYDWSAVYGSKSYRIREVILDQLPDGLYLVQGLQGDKEAQALLPVSSISVQIQQSQQDLLIRVADRAGSPIQDAVATFLDRRGKWQAFPVRSDRAGQIHFRSDELLDNQLLVKVEADAGRVAFTRTEFLSSEANPESLFLFTDRPLFKPGEQVQFKGIFRDVQGAFVRTLSPSATGGQAHLVTLSGEAASAKIPFSVSPFSTFSGEIGIDEAQAPGTYHLRTTVGDKEFSGELRIRDYKKPTFYIEVLQRDSIIRPGQKYHLSFRTKRFTGSPMVAKYEVFVYRKRFELPQWKDEGGMGLSADTDYQGVERSASALAQPQRIYSSAMNRATAGESGNPWLTAPTVDASGTAKVEIDLPKIPNDDSSIDWTYTVLVRAMDSTGAQAVVSENIPMSLSDAIGALRFEKSVFPSSEQVAQVHIQTRSLLGEPIGGVEGRLLVSYEQRRKSPEDKAPVSFISDSAGRASISLPLPKDSARVTAKILLHSRDSKPFGRPFESPSSTAVVLRREGDTVGKSDKVELLPASTLLTPGEVTSVVALLPDQFAGTTIWETIGGKQVFQPEAHTVHGKSKIFSVTAKPEYGSGFFQTVTVPLPNGKYAEQTVGYRVVPNDKRLSIRVEPSALTTSPYEKLPVLIRVQNAAGAPVGGVELAVSVVDKAVYHVQPELRPHVLEFFYPFPRLNIGTFFSQRLQGYGYADEVNFPTFRLSALKSQVKPTKRGIRDTAGWFPHLITDERGEVLFSVDLPANETEWLVTAIAIDEAGRVGEGKGTFISRSDFDVDALFPSFLRTGDRAIGHLEFQNRQGGAVSTDFKVESGVALHAVQPVSASLTVPAKGEAKAPLPLTALAETTGGILSVSYTSPLNSRREFEFPVKSSLLTRKVRMPFDGQKIQIPSAVTGAISSISIRAFSGLFGAAVSAGNALVSYPYGCAEQLVHSTIPNLALLELLSKQENDKSKYGLDTSLAKAKENARLGLAKLLSLQNSDGSFRMWPGETEGDPFITILVLRALKIASDHQIEGAKTGYYRSMQWVEKHKSQVTAFGGLGLALLSEAGSVDELSNEYAAFINRVVTERASISDVVFALRILKSTRDSYWIQEQLQNTDSERRLRQELVQRLEKDNSLTKLSALIPDENTRIPWQTPSFVAAIYEVLHGTPELSDTRSNEIKRILISLFENGWWGSTIDSAEVIFRLREVFAQDLANKKDDLESVITVQQGDFSFPLKRNAAGYFGESSSPREVQSGKGFSLNGAPSNLIVDAVAEVKSPSQEVGKYSSGVQLSRTLWKVTAAGGEQLHGGETLAVGDTVVSSLRVSRDGSPKGLIRRGSHSSFLIVKDFIPSLAQGLDEDREILADAKLVSAQSTNSANIKETRRFDDRTERVVEIAPGATIEVFQSWRIGFAGDATLPPATAVDMYNDNLFGNSDANKVVVE